MAVPKCPKPTAKTTVKENPVQCLKRTIKNIFLVKSSKTIKLIETPSLIPKSLFKLKAHSLIMMEDKGSLIWH